MFVQRAERNNRAACHWFSMLFMRSASYDWVLSARCQLDASSDNNDNSLVSAFEGLRRKAVVAASLATTSDTTLSIAKSNVICSNSRNAES